jgi:thioredoxin-dependent peroxiredoxin
MSLIRNIARSALATAALLVGVRAAEAMPKTGEIAPDFSLLSQEGAPVSLKDYRGHWVVLYFYPKDFTRGCTIQARNFQRDSVQYAHRDAVVLGVSVDDVKTHGEFCDKEGLSFKLLADTSASVSRAYGSVMKMPGKTLSERNTFLINPAGRIARVWRKVDVARHSEEVLEALAELQGEAPR